jgi:hypothetical protein
MCHPSKYHQAARKRRVVSSGSSPELQSGRPTHRPDSGVPSLGHREAGQPILFWHKGQPILGSNLMLVARYLCFLGQVRSVKSRRRMGQVPSKILSSSLCYYLYLQQAIKYLYKCFSLCRSNLGSQTSITLEQTKLIDHGELPTLVVYIMEAPLIVVRVLFSFFILCIVCWKNGTKLSILKAFWWA